MEVSNKFKSTIIKLGRQFNVLIQCNSNYKLITEDSVLLLTEDNINLITEQSTDGIFDREISGDKIWRLDKNNLGELFHTYMKSFDLQMTENLALGQLVNIKVGVKEETDADYEYADFGLYYVYKKEYNEDTKTYIYTLCDGMLKTMIAYNNATIFGNNEELQLKDFIKNCLLQCGFVLADIDIDFTHLINGTNTVKAKTFENISVTYRDVLDMAIECCGCSLVVETTETNNVKKEIITTRKISNNAVANIDEDVLSDKNLTFTNKCGPINSLLLSRASDLDNYEVKDNQSIAENGTTQYKIAGNLILQQENRQDFADELFEEIDGIEYYIIDIDCIGQVYIEYLDKFNIIARENEYGCLCLKNTFSLSNGLEEQFKSEQPSGITKQYTTASETNDKDAQILVNKLSGEIVLKTNSDGTISEVRLDSNADTGSTVEIKADNIKLEGYTTINDGFSIDEEGNMVAKSGEIAHWIIDDTKGIYTGDGNGQAGLGIEGYSHAFWAGGTNPGTAPFHVGHGGDVSCSDINITGGNIALSSTNNNAKLSIKDSSNANQITEFSANKLLMQNQQTFSSGTITNQYLLHVDGTYLGLVLSQNNPSQGVYIETQLRPGEVITPTLEGNGSLTIGIEGLITNSAGNGSVMIDGSNNVTLSANSGYVYAKRASYSASKVSTAAGNYSSKILKENIKDFNDYDDAIGLLRDMDLYTYDYKYKINDNKTNFGFIIDELEKDKRTKKFFNFEEETAIDKGNGILDVEGAKENPEDERIIHYKAFDDTTLTKYLLVVCKSQQEQIDELRKEIEELKGGNK